MREDIVFDALIDWNFWGNFREEIKPREMIPSIPKSDVALVIKGVRRCGKSRLSYLLAKKFSIDRSLIINFEDPRLRNLKVDDIFKIVEIYQRKVNPRLPKLLILDEVQNIGGWENIVRFYLEAKKIKVIVTGSSSKLMSEEYATVLTGRHIDFELFPLSLREILLWNNISFTTPLDLAKNRVTILNLLENFLKFGGFPEAVKIRDVGEKTKLLREYFYDIVIKDVANRFKVREIEKLENLAIIYLTNISTLQSFNRLKRVVNLSLDSVERFSKYFQIARLFLFIKKYGYSLKQQILSPRKVYCIDTGFYNVMGFRVSENIDRLMENIVLIELMRRRSYWYNDWEIYYWKDYQQREVDFVVKKGLNIRQLIQVTYVNDIDEIDKRELRALVKAGNLLNCKNMLIITWNLEDEITFKEERIKLIPLWKWLLETE